MGNGVSVAGDYELGGDSNEIERNLFNLNCLKNQLLDYNFSTEDCDSILSECLRAKVYSLDEVELLFFSESDFCERLPDNVARDLSRIFHSRSNQEDAPNSELNFLPLILPTSNQLVQICDVRQLLMELLASSWLPTAENVLQIGIEKLKELYDYLMSGLENEYDQSMVSYTLLVQGLRDLFLTQNTSLIQLEQRSQQLVILDMWSIALSSNSLEFSAVPVTATRIGQTGVYPVAAAQSHSLLSCISIKLDRAPRRDSYLSIGFSFTETVNDSMCGSGCFGKFPGSWGLIDRRNSTQNSEIYAQGMLVGEIASIQEGAVVSLFLDIRNVDAGFNAGFCHLLVDDHIVYTFTGLCCSREYLFGASLCADHSLTIVPRNVLEIVEARNAQEDAPASVTAEQREEAAPQTIFTGHADPRPPVPSFLPRDGRLLEVPRPTPEARSASKSGPAVDDNPYCCICLSGPKCVVLLPCRHLCVCDGCGMANGVRIPLRHCPICRMQIEQRMKVFLS